MELSCERCGKKVERLIPIDYAAPLVQYTEILGVPYTGTDHVCIDCAKLVLEMSNQDIPAADRLRARRTASLLAALRARLARAVVETVLREFGYEIHPPGYDGPDAAVVQLMRKKEARAPVKDSLTSPDFFVHGREVKDGDYVRVLEAPVQDDGHLWVSQYLLASLKLHWPEAILVMCPTPSIDLQALSLGRFEAENLLVEQSPLTGRYHLPLGLNEDFHPLPELFSLVDAKRLPAFMKEVRAALSSWAGPAP